MLRSSIALIAIGLCGLGCRPVAHQRVYVDFEAVLASYSASPLPSKPTPRPPAGLPAKTLSITAVAPRTVVVEGMSAEKANAMLEKSRAQAVKELTTLLAERYVRDAERASAERIRNLEPAKQKEYELAQNAIRSEFESYANKRGAKVAALTSLVGFPDPNPESLPPTTTVPAFVQVRLNQAAQLRKDIKALDDEYQARVKDLLAAAESKYQTSLSEAKLLLEQDRAAAFRRAESEATAQIAKSYASFRPLVMGSSRIDLPGQPAQSVTLPAVPPPMGAPNVRERPLTADQRRNILRSQLNIWLAVNGYDLADRPDGVPNLTKDFVRWRKERQL